jgi:hypothetical protein
MPSMSFSVLAKPRLWVLGHDGNTISTLWAGR